MTTTAALSYLAQATPDNPIAYWDRHKMAQDAGVVLNVYVMDKSHPVSRLVIPGSAIVGLPFESDPDRTLVYFEGDKFGRNMDYAEKMIHAVDRMVVRYPTVAMGSYPTEQLKQIGTYDVSTKTLTIDDADALEEWTRG